MRAPTNVLPGMAMANAMTIDVEDYFQVPALAPYIARSQWDTLDGRVEANVERILAMLDEYGTHATFFTLGWIAERYPRTHPPDRRQRPRAREPRLCAPARDRAEPGGLLLGHPAREDRARGSDRRGGDGLSRAQLLDRPRPIPWAFECIERAGYRYSSSVYPIQHDHYGMPDAPRFAHDVREGLPRGSGDDDAPLRPQLAGRRRRLLPPVALRDVALASAAGQSRRPAAGDLLFPPWEIDPAQPRVPGIDAKTRFRHYLNLDRMERRLRKLLFDFEWGRVDEVMLEAA